MEELERLKKYVVSEKVDIPRKTVQGLLEVLQETLKQRPSPQKIVYTRGESHLYVEKLVTREFDAETLATPYESIRQYAELSVLDPSVSIYQNIYLANVLLSENSCTTTFAVVFNKNNLTMPHTELAKALQVPILEDADCPEDFLFICGSSIDDTIGSVEWAAVIPNTTTGESDV